MPKRLFIQDGGLTSSIPTPPGFTVIGADGGIPKKQVQSTISDIGDGPPYYKFNQLPKSYVAQSIPDSDILGDAITINGGSLPYEGYNYIRLSNGNLAYIDYISNSTKSEILIYNAFDIETIEPNNGYWVAYKVDDDNPNLFVKIAEAKQTDDFFTNGWEYSYISQTNENECKFIYASTNPNSDSYALFSNIATLNITKTGATYSLTVTETSFNFDGKDVITLYNENAPVPVAPGTVDWQYKNPLYSMQNDYFAMMTGVEEGWVWYGNGNSNTTLYSYMVGFNILTGQTSFIEPVSSLNSTTNFNPFVEVGAPVDSTFITGWQNPPSGVCFIVYNKQFLDHGNNTNGVTAIYSPRWVNNNLVTFLTQRNPRDGIYTCRDGNILVLINFSNSFYAFDNQYIYLNGIFSGFGNQGSIIVISRFKLDSIDKVEEIKVLPLATSGDNTNGLSYWEIENGILLEVLDPDFNLYAFQNNQYARYYFNYWINTSENINRLQSNTVYPTNVINNKFYSCWNLLCYNTYSLGIQYDEYNLV